MLEQVIFCNDGKLRLTGFMRQALPLELLQKDYSEKTGKSGDFYLLRHIDSPVIIEKGTTLSNVMLALEPWAEMLGFYLKKDVSAFIDEFKKDVSATSIKAIKKGSWIGIGRVISFSMPYKQKERELDEGVNDMRMSFRVKREYTTEPSDAFKMLDAVHASYYVEGIEEHYSLSFGPHYRDVPVFIDNKIKVHQFNKKDLREDMCLLNSNANSVKRVDGYNVATIEEDSFGALTFAEVLKAIFIYGFSAYSPEDSERQASTIADIIKGSESEKEQAKQVLSDWYDEELKAISEIKGRISPKDSRAVMMEDFKQAIAPEERLYNKII